MQVLEDTRPALPDSPRFEVPIFLHEKGFFSGQYLARLGIDGFTFESRHPPRLGDRLQAELVLHGLGRAVTVTGRVVAVELRGDHASVAARFEDLPFELERLLARWLDLLVAAGRPQAA